VGRVVTGATGRGLVVGQVVGEIGSGMNGQRRKLTKLLSDPAASVIVVEHHDRLTRLGFEHLQASRLYGRRSAARRAARAVAVATGMEPG
jgi:putative resolvase